jgi:hypothetical protein
LLKKMRIANPRNGRRRTTALRWRIVSGDIL